MSRARDGHHHARIEKDTPDAGAQLDMTLSVEGLEFVGELRRRKEAP